MPETGVFATLELIIHPKANKSKVFFGKSFGKMKKRFAGGKKYGWERKCF